MVLDTCKTKLFHAAVPSVSNLKGHRSTAQVPNDGSHSEAYIWTQLKLLN